MTETTWLLPDKINVRAKKIIEDIIHPNRARQFREHIIDIWVEKNYTNVPIETWQEINKLWDTKKDKITDIINSLTEQEKADGLERLVRSRRQVLEGAAPLIEATRNQIRKDYASIEYKLKLQRLHDMWQCPVVALVITLGIDNITEIDRQWFVDYFQQYNVSTKDYVLAELLMFEEGKPLSEIKRKKDKRVSRYAKQLINNLKKGELPMAERGKKPKKGDKYLDINSTKFPVNFPAEKKTLDTLIEAYEDEVGSADEIVELFKKAHPSQKPIYVTSIRNYLLNKITNDGVVYKIQFESQQPDEVSEDVTYTTRGINIMPEKIIQNYKDGGGKKDIKSILVERIKEVKAKPAQGDKAAIAAVEGVEGTKFDMKVGVSNNNIVTITLTSK